jgi:hypothetical protein
MSRAPLKIICGSNRLPHRIHFITSGNYPQGPPLTWTTKSGKKGFLSIVAYYVTANGKLCDLPIALPQLTGAYTGERMAEVVLIILQKFEINTRKISYFMLNNTSNNDSTIQAIAHKPEWDFDPIHRRLCYGPHTLNLIGQVLL